jgi:hypothetical protein
MWLIICTPEDEAALWAYQGLRARGLAPLELVMAGDLAFARHWEHRIGAAGASTDVVLADGREIRGREVRGVLNRLQWLPTDSLALIRPGDREYVSQELAAFYLSWLYSLPAPMLNRPTPQGLAGQWRHPSAWAWLATMARLPVADLHKTSQDLDGHGALGSPYLPPGANPSLFSGPPVQTVFVIAGCVIGPPLPTAIREGCQRLAALSGAGLLGIDLLPGGPPYVAPVPPGAWTFGTASPIPDLRRGGEELLDQLAVALTEGREAGR